MTKNDVIPLAIVSVRFCGQNETRGTPGNTTLLSARVVFICADFDGSVAQVLGRLEPPRNRAQESKCRYRP
jgi:hypothetical protein